MRDPVNLGAAIGYYRAMLDPTRLVPAYAEEQKAVTQVPPQPFLYLHGRNDGALGVDLVGGAAALLSPGSRVDLLDGVGHFLHLEQAARVNALVLDWLTA